VFVCSSGKFVCSGPTHARQSTKEVQKKYKRSTKKYKEVGRVIQQTQVGSKITDRKKNNGISMLQASKQAN
jgi:hypothetical protein